MAELIQKTDTLNEGREKLNEAIKDAEKAKIDSSEALDTANTALSKSESTQTQLDNIVIDGDSSVEAAQARVDKDGKTYGTLKERLDTEHGIVTSQLADTVLGINNNTITPVYENGLLKRIEEKKDGVVVKSVDLNFNNGLLVEVIETINDS